MDYLERMKEYYERRAAEYDGAYLGTGAYSGRDRPGFGEELARVVTLVEGLPPARVLDVGCGTGFMTRHLKGEVVGLDQSAAMLRIAQGRVPGASFVRGDALSLPFPDGAFGRAFVGNLLGVLPPPERAALVREARRVASAARHQVEPTVDRPATERSSSCCCPDLAVNPPTYSRSNDGGEPVANPARRSAVIG